MFCAIPLLVGFCLFAPVCQVIMGVLCLVCSLLVAGWIQVVVSWLGCFFCMLLSGLASGCFLEVSHDSWVYVLLAAG
jgi:hypothetical protein